MLLTAGLLLLWLLSLAVALAASEGLVRAVSHLGVKLHFSVGLLGLLIALGADAPEVTSALLALQQGQASVGLGVVFGSNTYNLAGLLGLSALLAGPLLVGSRIITLDDSINVVVTVLVGVALLLPDFRLVASLLALVLYLGYAGLVVTGTDRRLHAGWTPPADSGSAHHSAPLGDAGTGLALVLALGSVILIVAGSEGLVHYSLTLGPRLGVPHDVIGLIVLAIATSLPNTYAAVTLSRRGLATSAISATFNSNSINLVAAVVIPLIVTTVHAPASIGHFDVPYLLGMTLVAIALLATRHALSRWEGGLLVALYLVFALLSATIVR